MTARETIAFWDAEAARFDDAADHGLRDPAIRAAWRDLLLSVLPPAPARVVDLGCGTGTLSLLLAEEGYAVHGVDLSPEMIRLATAKAGESARFVQGDASMPPLAPASYDVVLSRHVLWAMPDPPAALARWLDLLAPEGQVVLVEGNWSTGAGLTAAETVAMLERAGSRAELTRVPEAQYWGREITDERYLVVGR